MPRIEVRRSAVREMRSQSRCRRTGSATTNRPWPG